MSTSGHDKAAIILSAWLQIHEALEASKAWLRGILILMWPWLVSRKIRAIVEANVNSIERDNKIFGAVNFLEYIDNARLRSNLPNKVLMGTRVV